MDSGLDASFTKMILTCHYTRQHCQRLLLNVSRRTVFTSRQGEKPSICPVSIQGNTDSQWLTSVQVSGGAPSQALRPSWRCSCMVRGRSSGTFDYLGCG